MTAAKTTVQVKRRQQTFQARLLRNFVVTLGVVAVILVLGYWTSLVRQTATAATFEESSRVRELSLEVQREFLLARQNEAAFLDRWSQVGFDAAQRENAMVAQNYLSTARNKLDELEKLLQVARDPELQGITAQITALRPLLAEYEAAFLAAVGTIQERSRTDGVEAQLEMARRRLEDALQPLPNPALYLLVLQLRVVEQSYFSTGHQQYVDNVQLLAKRLQDLVSVTPVEDLQNGTTQLTAAEVHGLVQNYLVAFNELVALERSIDISVTVF